MIQLRWTVSYVAIPVCLCVMKTRCINLRVTLPKDKGADPTCTASLIIILRWGLWKGCSKLTWSIHISGRSTQPNPFREVCRFRCLETRRCGAVQSCALEKNTIVSWSRRYWCNADRAGGGERKSGAVRLTCEPHVQKKVLGQLFLSSQVIKLYQLSNCRQGRQPESCQFPGGRHSSNVHCENNTYAMWEGIWTVSSEAEQFRDWRAWMSKKNERATCKALMAIISWTLLWKVCKARSDLFVFDLTFQYFVILASAYTIEWDLF